MQIASQTSLQKKITKLLKPLLKFLFPEIKEGEEVHNEISMNMVANLMGLGNAATPLRIKSNEFSPKEKPKKRYTF